MFDDHEPGCPLHDPANWLRAAAGNSEAQARLAELDDATTGIPAEVLRRVAPDTDERALAWCTCGTGTPPPDDRR